MPELGKILLITSNGEEVPTFPRGVRVSPEDIKKIDPYSNGLIVKRYEYVGDMAVKFGPQKEGIPTGYVKTVDYTIGVTLTIDFRPDTHADTVSKLGYYRVNINGQYYYIKICYPYMIKPNGSNLKELIANKINQLFTES
jgi:hypothetical protein